MIEMIDARNSSETKEERYDLFSSLIDANDGHNSYMKLSTKEVIGEQPAF